MQLLSHVRMKRIRKSSPLWLNRMFKLKKVDNKIVSRVSILPLACKKVSTTIEKNRMKKNWFLHEGRENYGKIIETTIKFPRWIWHFYVTNNPKISCFKWISILIESKSKTELFPLLIFVRLVQMKRKKRTKKKTSQKKGNFNRFRVTVNLKNIALLLTF